MLLKVSLWNLCLYSVVFWWALITPGLFSKRACSNFQLRRWHLLWPIFFHVSLLPKICGQNLPLVRTVQPCHLRRLIWTRLLTLSVMSKQAHVPGSSSKLDRATYFSLNPIQQNTSVMLLSASVFCWIRLRKPEPWRFAWQGCFFVILVTVQWQMETIGFLLVFNDFLTYFISQSSK